MYDDLHTDTQDLMGTEVNSGEESFESGLLEDYEEEDEDNEDESNEFVLDGAGDGSPSDDYHYDTDIQL